MFPLSTRINILHRCTTSLPFKNVNESDKKIIFKIPRNEKLNDLRDVSAAELFISRLNDQFGHSHEEIRTIENEIDTRTEDEKTINADELEKLATITVEENKLLKNLEVIQLCKDFPVKQNVARIVRAGMKVDSFWKSVTRQSVYEAAERYFNGSATEMLNLVIFARLHADKNKGTDLREKATYHELVAMDNFKRDILKTASTFVLPFVPAVGFVCMLLPPMRHICPRKMLARSYWSPKQINTYYVQNHIERLLELCEVMHKLEKSEKVRNDSSGFVKKAVDILLDNKIVNNSELLQLKSCFRKNPILLDDVQMPVLRSLCKIFEVNSLGTTKALKRRLHNKAGDLMAMDRKLRNMDLSLLSNDDVMQACYMRCVNSVALSREANEYWLRNWLLISKECAEEDTNFYLYSMVVQATSYSENNFYGKGFG